MVPEKIAEIAISLIVPFLVKGGEAIATGVGESLWKTIKKPFTSDRDKALIEDLEKNPEDLKLQGKAEGKLEDLLRDHPEIAKEISKLIPKIKKAHTQFIIGRDMHNNNGNTFIFYFYNTNSDDLDKVIKLCK